MRNGIQKSTASGQLRWVMLLLAIAVILPTICLLWFMTQAVKNERLAGRQKLQGIYLANLQNYAKDHLTNKWLSLNLATVSTNGSIVYDPNSRMTFPVLDDPENTLSDDIFQKAHQEEYRDIDPNKAIEEYRSISEKSDSNAIRITADIAIARCQKKCERYEQAIDALLKIISDYQDNELFIRAQKCRAHLLLLELVNSRDDFDEQLNAAIDYALSGMAEANDFAWLGRPERSSLYIPSALQVFALKKCLDYSHQANHTVLTERRLKYIEKIIQFVETSINISNRYPNPSFVVNPGLVGSPVFSLEAPEQLYGQYGKLRDYVILGVVTKESARSWFNGFVQQVESLPSVCRIYDEEGRLVAGNADEYERRKPFIKTRLDIGCLPGWQVELYIDDAAYELAAKRQAAIYTWTGILVVLLILACGAVAAQVIGKQIKLNRLKNDFIATVSHEIKTPLASMRVLVDTLLEGNYNDQQTASEYLQLISKENIRLSRLIDNFLTFSRMERNKQAFDIVRTSPAEIAGSAADAVQTKFKHESCKFTVTIDDNLPFIMADKDAMVTVLVNLLDNAYKYSYDDKQIELRVSAESAGVCFWVKDNGIGMTRRQTRKIFDRFYQADSSLSRRTEGTGLGLAIVKFIIDAHKGQITVESKPDKGSTFTIKLNI